MRFFAVQSLNSRGEENNCRRNHMDFLYVYGIVYGVKTNMKRTATIKRNSRIQTGNEASQIVLEKAFDEDAARARREIMQKYRSDDSVHQIMIVSHTDGWNGNMSFYEKAGENDAWTLVLEGEVYIGKNGMNKIKEGDAKTPYGDFEILQAFGILPNPGTSIDYIDVTPDTFACDEDCEFYNQIINVKETGHACKGEEMYKLSPEYNYGLTTSYNRENEYPKGSAIFVHCKGQKHYTGGCIALDEADLKAILEKAEPGMRLYLDEYYVINH